MPEAENSFALLPDLARRMPRIDPRRKWLWGLVYRLRALWRRLRVCRPLTRLLGPQYRRSRDLIEIDITYACNLHCLNCNRSVRQAREALHMPVSTVVRFVEDSIARGKRWRRIRVLGGEPTVHPQFHEILAQLRRYREFHPACLVEVVTNGHGALVQAQLAALPDDVLVDNSAKESVVQPHFGPFNLAPIDDRSFAHADFSNACAVARDCGMGLTPTGYYPCAVAGGIDRIVQENLGLAELPKDTDDMLEACARLCRLCGRFRDGHYVPRVLRPALTTEMISPTWRTLYARWHASRRAATAAASIPSPRPTGNAP